MVGDGWSERVAHKNLKVLIERERKMEREKRERKKECIDKTVYPEVHCLV